ncbi:tRNA preQ1(34) S-adenosylmethionine ribosyltransferase-isomerase QueA [Candidatus Peregrinibacteria bacterium]|nr:MAG: tRNA preQ1(34) S-adenosylmethionine ribosyltransferase-isomerase QueA [Candidatus Peregrinibacteria bacterium]
MDSLYTYTLPERCIAQTPASPRDHSKLLIYDTASGAVSFDRYLNLDRYLPQDSLLVMNESKVLPCRVPVKGPKNEPLELLVMSNEWKPSNTVLLATVNKKLQPGERLALPQGHRLTVLESTEKIFRFKASFNLARLPEVLARIGQMPVPRYIKDCPLTEEELRKKYQTVFAKKPGSVAAPTASLHFTPRLFKKLKKKGHELAFVTLHVGLGTFAPVLPEHLESRTLYKEYYEIPENSRIQIEKHKAAGKPIFAVGTTSTRTLEAWAETGANKGPTELFILPPYPFQVLDGLLTNFHIPGSSLMMLVEAFLQHKKAKHHLKDLYASALEKEFRFYSFGDGMLIL